MNTHPNCQLHHVCIQTSDFQRAFQFYTEALGLGIIKAPFLYKEKKWIAWLSAGPMIIELNGIEKGKEDQAQPYTSYGMGPSHVAFMVEDLDVLIERLVGHQVRVVKAPFLPPTGDPGQPRVAFIEGPDGDHIELREPEKVI